MRVSSTHRSQIVNKLRASGCVFAEDEAQLLISAAGTMSELSDMVDRRVAGQPIEYIVGWTEFCGLRIFLEAGVFVPRRRTEFLVQQAIAVANSCDNTVVDLCCGSGAVGAAIVAALGHAELFAVDIETSAVRCARRNVGTIGPVFTGDLYEPLSSDLQGRVNLLVANAPYVPTQAIAMMPQEARLYEPTVALDGGPDGLDVQRRVIAEASRWLAPGGHLLVETSRRQAMHTFEMFSNHGLIPRIATSDELEAAVVLGTTPAG